MDPDLFLIFGFIIVVTAIVMGTIARVTKRSMEYRHREKELQSGIAAGSSPQISARMDEMEQRLRVLERIATDGVQGSALAAEIEALRLDDGRNANGRRANSTQLVMPQGAGEKVL